MALPGCHNLLGASTIVPAIDRCEPLAFAASLAEHLSLPARLETKGGC